MCIFSDITTKQEFSQFGSGEEGTYFFSTYLSVDYDEYGVFEIEINNEAVCTAFRDHSNIESTEVAQATCSTVVNVNEGKYYCAFCNFLITARKRSLGQGNIFRSVCHSVHGGST